MAKSKDKVYWKGLDEREQTPEFKQTLESEFPASPDEVGKLLEDAKLSNVRLSRRSFLKAAGFSIAGTALASCARGPVEKSLPLLIKPEEITPGKAVWYASTCGGCRAGCGILVKTREGRPIKIEGNPEHPLSKGGVCAVGQAMVLTLYDSKRLLQPQVQGQETDWSRVDALVREALTQGSGRVVLLTGTITSPSTRAEIERFLTRFPNGQHVEYDPVSYSAILDAHEHTHGQRRLPHYRFDRAEVIVSFEADFLGTWLSPVEFTRAYVRGRTLEGKPPRLSRHIQFEGRLSLTGSNADQRIKVTPDQAGAALVEIAERVAQYSGRRIPDWRAGWQSSGVAPEVIEEVANALWEKRGRSLVVCGLNDVGLQRVVNFLNHALNNYGNTLDLERPSRQWNGNDRAVQELFRRMQAGEVDALILADVNPVYSLPYGQTFGEALQKVPFTLALSHYVDETAERCQVVAPLLHPLEAWDDAEVVPGQISVSQPVIHRMGNPRSLREALAAWRGKPQDDLSLVQAFWRQHIFPRQRQFGSFQPFWDRSVHDGFAEVPVRPEPVGSFQVGSDKALTLNPELPQDAFALVLYEKVGMRDGRHAFNPWLQELPDPVTKATWDNYVCLAPATAKRLGIQQGQVVRVTAGEATVELPALLQPGQHEQVVAIALGYGRKGTDRFSKIGPQWLQSKLTVAPGDTVGRNAFVLAQAHARSLRFDNRVQLTPTDRKMDLALTQTHHTITVPENLGGQRRDMVRETVLAAYIKDPASGNRYEHEVLQLWPNDFVYTGHHWALAIDLNRCTGCSACVVSCQAENNVPVVGKDEVHRRRELHWIRIDRYYSGDDGDVDVMFQPVMCQHCDHAPCESVCPVLATVHSEEGINQQIYNRCVGTRYCANNCPYKVRRFNWFDYWRRDEKENLVLNPDVTTRSRGVMEKCSLCVQRIQEARAEARRQGRDIADGEVKLACEQSCPADAIVFGDMNDPNSRVSKLIADPRHYRMLEEMNFRPTVGYMTKVRNREEGVEG